jgi:hypothetical protein
MERGKLAYQERFPVGSKVRIKNGQYLEEFLRSWKYHHPISVEQVACSGQLDCVTSVGFYHGGDVLYNLEKAPGIWHEQLLEAA